MQFKITDEDNTLLIEGDADIVSESGPVVLTAAETCTIRGTGGTVTMRAKESQQPVIGGETHTGMSYGRWSPYSGKTLKKLIIDNIDLTLMSATPCFAIGNYGFEDFPEIELVNGAKLTSADYHMGSGKKRYLTYKPVPPSGSTKISESCEYVYCEPEQVVASSERIQENLKKKQGVQHIPQTSKFMSTDVPAGITWEIEDTLSRKPEWAKMLEEDPGSTEVNKVAFYKYASILPVTEQEVRDILAEGFVWFNNLIGEVNLCAALACLYCKYMKIDHSGIFAIDMADEIKKYVTKQDIDKADDDMIQFYWALISPLNYSQWHRNDKIKDCIEYFD